MTFASLLSEARKFKTHFCLAAQYGEQLHPTVRAAVLGNAGTLMVFRVSSNDAQLLAPEFHPLPELADQSPYTAWLRRGDTGHRAIYLEPSLYPARKRREPVMLGAVAKMATYGAFISGRTQRRAMIPHGRSRES
jgi:hypothetical protein